MPMEMSPELDGGRPVPLEQIFYCDNLDSVGCREQWQRMADSARGRAAVVPSNNHGLGPKRGGVNIRHDKNGAAGAEQRRLDDQVPFVGSVRTALLSKDEVVRPKTRPEDLDNGQETALGNLGFNRDLRRPSRSCEIIQVALRSSPGFVVGSTMSVAAVRWASKRRAAETANRPAASEPGSPTTRRSLKGIAC